MQLSISPVSLEVGTVGKGTSRFPALSQPRLGNGDTGSAGAEDVAQVPSRAAWPRSDNKAAGCWITVPSQEIKHSVCWMRSRIHPATSLSLNPSYPAADPGRMGAQLLSVGTRTASPYERSRERVGVLRK